MPAPREPGPLTQEQVTRQVKRLISSGLPLEPFVRTVFDLVAAALPVYGVSTLLADLRQRLTRCVPGDPHIFEKTIDADIGTPPETPGAINGDSSHFSAESLPIHDKITLVRYRRSAERNELMRRLNFSHHMIAARMQRSWLIGQSRRSASSRARSASPNDARFVAAIASHTTRGVMTAPLLKPGPCSADDFAPLGDWEPGFILLGPDGRLLAASTGARSLFSQIGLFDGWPAADAVAEDEVRGGFSCVARILERIFDERAQGFGNLRAPFRLFYSHESGIALSLRGLALDGENGLKCTTVIVEPGELKAHRRLRIMHRYGLSPREFELLENFALGRRTSEIRATMGISAGTLKTYRARVAEKLEQDGTVALRTFAMKQLGSDRPLT